MKEVNAEFVNSSKDNLVVLFSAPWCKPCLALKPVVEQMEKEFTDLVFVTIDVDKDAQLATKYSIRSVPTLLYLKNQEIKGRITGTYPQTKIREMLNC
jgi:thioredoxin 1